MFTGNYNEDATIDFKCPNCNAALQITVKDIETQNNQKCSCGLVVDIPQESADQIKQLRKTIEGLLK